MKCGKSFFLYIMLVCTLFVSAPVHALSIVHYWSQRFGDAIDQYGWSVAVDGAGNVVVTGWFYGTVDFGGGALTSAGSWDIFIAKFDAAGGHLWSQRFGDASDQYGNSVAVDGAGNVVVTGYFQGTVDFGDGALTSAGDLDMFIAKFDAAGTHLWSQRFGDASLQRGECVAVDGTGNVVVTGYFGGTVNFGGNNLTSAGNFDIFIAKFDAAGEHLCSKRFGDESEQRAYSVAVDSESNFMVTGWFFGTVDFGGGALTCVGINDIFMAKFDGACTHLWSQRFGDESYQEAISVAVDGVGNVVITGCFEGTVDFGGGALTSAGGVDILIAKFDAAGGHLCSQRFGDAGDQYGRGVTVDGAGNVVVTGHFHGTVDFGGGVLTSAGGLDVFMAKFDGACTHLWSQRFGDSSDQYVPHGLSVALDAAGNIVVTGYFEGTLDFGGGPLTSAGDQDIYIAKFGYGTIPTLLRNYSAICKSSTIELEWQLAEAGVGMEFSILRSEVPRTAYRELENPGISGDGFAYHLIDDTCQPGLTYRYRVDVIDEDGREVLFETEPIGIPPLSLTLGPNYPNPFSRNTRIPFVIDRDNRVSLAIYDLSGKLICTLINRPMDLGSYSEEWDGRDTNGNSVASGVYFYQLKAGKDIRMRKAVFLK